MLMQSMNFTMDVAGQFSVLLILSVLGLLLNSLVTEVRRRVLFWDPSQKLESNVDGQKGEAFHEMGVRRRRTRRRGRNLRRRSLGADHRARRLVRPHGQLGGRAVRDRHQDGLVREGRHQGRAGAAAGLDRLRQAGRHPGRVDYSLPSIEPLAIIRPQGVKAKNFYTAYQGNIYGIAVPADSPVKTFADLKGKRIGVTSMASAGVIIARALAAMNGMDPDRDISIVVAGEAAQTAALLRSGQVDALSQFDTQYALTENAGVKLRMLDKDNEVIARFPANGFIALEETLANKRAEAVALAQGYAKGTVFAIANPEAAIRILWEVFPQTKATGKDEATALRDDIKTLEARAEELAARSRRRHQMGRELGDELRRLCRFPGEERRAQAEGRRQRSHHQRADRRHQQVRRLRAIIGLRFLCGSTSRHPGKLLAVLAGQAGPGAAHVVALRPVASSRGQLAASSRQNAASAGKRGRAAAGGRNRRTRRWRVPWR